MIEEIEATSDQVSAQSHLRQGEALYRRGAVFGLTVAEIFILLVFVLLLVFLALARQWQSEQRETEERLERARAELDVFEPWKPVIAEFEAPEEVATLRLAEAKAKRELETLREVVEESGEPAENRTDLLNRLREAVDKQVAVQEESERIREELRVLREKGVNPPCWYEKVPTTDGALREKPFYTFNLAVFDDGIVVRKLETPPGVAKDDGGESYARESEQLGLGQLLYDSLLSDAEFLDQFRDVQRAGKEKQVRSYSCIFWVRVWDKTSATAKERWKEAHLNIVQGLFGTYVVREDPWMEST